MAKITFGPIVADARRKAGDIVFTRTRGGAVAKALALTPIPLPVLKGGTGTNTGSITGTGALTFASATSTNINLNPGTGGKIVTAKPIESTLATGTAPLIIASQTPVDNLNVSIVNWVWISNQPTAGQVLIAKSTSEAAWATPDGARVYHDATQSCLTAQTTIFAFNHERYDNGGMHDNVTNNSRLTVKKAGRYLAVGTLAIDGNATGYRRAAIKDNYGNLWGIDWKGGSAADYQSFSVTALMYLAVNDYLELQLYQNSGSTRTTVLADGYSVEFAMQWLGP